MDSSVYGCKEQAKLYIEVLVLNPAKYLSISLQVERLQQGV